MSNKQIKVNNQYSISRIESQWVCTFHAVEFEQQEEVIKTFPCLLSLHEYLTEESGYCGNDLMNAVSQLLEMKP
jgi:hypothetical protein